MPHGGYHGSVKGLGQSNKPDTSAYQQAAQSMMSAGISNLSGSTTSDKKGEEAKKIDSALLYANEYKVDLIDRIAQVEEKIQPVDLTSVFSQIGKVREEIAMLDIPEDTDLTDVYAEISGVKESVAGIKIPNIDGLKKDIKEIKTMLSDMERNIAIAMKENEVQDAQIDEIKLQSKNPLGG